MVDVRCDTHQGENYPPRCSLCESLSIEYALLKIDPPRVELEQHTARHRNSQIHTTHTTQRSK